LRNVTKKAQLSLFHEGAPAVVVFHDRLPRPGRLSRLFCCDRAGGVHIVEAGARKVRLSGLLLVREGAFPTPPAESLVLLLRRLGLRLFLRRRVLNIILHARCGHCGRHCGRGYSGRGQRGDGRRRLLLLLLLLLFHFHLLQTLNVCLSA